MNDVKRVVQTHGMGPIPYENWILMLDAFIRRDPLWEEYATVDASLYFPQEATLDATEEMINNAGIPVG